ncbi:MULTISPECIES: SIMPL domain-containing protein [Flavobacteriaceae]|uniref:SIMPL domain-containing protein n=1 Tax=Flavobacteriaceae TaxID=49546 RepID=UPI001491F3C3|nr:MULTISPECIES: SIMPL domain-containing protein [Allomuricauda]MDC6366411.1 SIMPL domain-containing protein [Muricauda sp. AC10]
MKCFLIILLFLSYNIQAQEVTSIKVLGSARHLDETPAFYGSVTLSGAYSSYPEDAMTLTQMKEKYDAALQKNGLSLDRLTENPMAYVVLGHEKEGTVYEYKSSSLEEFIKFLDTKSWGVQRLNYGAKVTIDTQEAEKLLKKAIQNAQGKAEVIARIQGKQLGGILQITDKNEINNSQHVSMYYDQPLSSIRYDVEVTFSLK